MFAKLKEYWPLIVVVLLSLVMSLAVHHDNVNPLSQWMGSSMGFFLCLLSMFKLFDIQGFADGFQMYDIIGKHFRLYAMLYPFMELALGLSYLAHALPLATNLITLIVMSISALGVIKSIQAGMNIRCACLGTVLKVPLSTVSVIENVGMGLMAAYNITAIMVF